MKIERCNLDGGIVILFLLGEFVSSDSRAEVIDLTEGNEVKNVASDVDSDLLGILEQLSKEVGKGIVFNLSKLSFIDSTRIGHLARLNRKLGEMRKRMVICSPTPRIEGVFDTLGLIGPIRFFETQDEAVDYLQGTPTESP